MKKQIKKNKQMHKTFVVVAIYLKVPVQTVSESRGGWFERYTWTNIQT